VPGRELLQSKIDEALIFWEKVGAAYEAQPVAVHVRPFFSVMRTQPFPVAV